MATSEIREVAAEQDVGPAPAEGPSPRSVVDVAFLTHIVVAALAMVATLPGRTHGLGLVTEPLLADLNLDRVVFALINLWATLLGALFCLPVGWLIDRLGVRVALAGVTLPLGLVVVTMSQMQPSWSIAPVFLLGGLVLLTRGFGQSALSVVSLAVMGKAIGRRVGVGVGIYSALVALGFMGAFAGVKYLLEQQQFEWRTLWLSLGLVVFGFGLVSLFLLHPICPSPERVDSSGAMSGEPGFTLMQALRTPAFWIFALTTSLYGMVASGLSLFNQSILQERGFDRGVFLTITTITPLIGLAGNLLTGWLGRHGSYQRLLALAMLGLMLALALFPRVQTLTQVYLYAVVLGFTGGMITVVFFGVWAKLFGAQHLGQIQGAAQMLTVVAPSAVGPLVLASCQRWTGSYIPAFQLIAFVAGLLGLIAWWVPSPSLASVASSPVSLTGDRA